MNNEERDQALYKYPGSDVLRNKLGIQDAETLDMRERQLVSLRVREGVPGGDFDVRHLQNIHHHLFQDVYEWAGELRQVEFHKGGYQFLSPKRLEMGMADVHKRLSEQQFLQGRSADDFATEAAEYIGDINRLHPFREGNGRTQLLFLQQLGEQAGHTIDLTRFTRETWIPASIESTRFHSARMAECIKIAVSTEQQRQELDLDKVKQKAEEHLRKERESRSQSQDNGQGKDI